MALCPYCEQKLPPGVIGLGRTLTAAGGAISLTGTHLTVDGQSVSLGPTQAELLRVLLLRFERWIPTEVLHAALYAHLPEDRCVENISVQVYTLRAKLVDTRLAIEGRQQAGYRATLLETPGSYRKPRTGRQALLQAIIDIGEGVTNAQLAERCGLPIGDVRSHLSKMRKFDWLQIQPGPRRESCDGRKVLITEKGRAILLAQPL